MVAVKTEIEISLPIDKVSGYAADPDKAPEWYGNIKSAERQDRGPLQVGSKVDFTARFLGRELKYTYEVVRHVPCKELAMKTSQGPFPMKTIYTWEAAGPTTTRMTLQNIGTPSGFSKMLAPFVALAIRWENAKDLRKIKAVLETQAG